MKPCKSLCPALFLSLSALTLPALSALAAPSGVSPFGTSPFGASIYDVSPLGADALLCIQGECEPAISKTTFFDRPAYKLTNGAVEAIVVPEIGRVMRFGKVGGPNLMWNNSQTQLTNDGWKNYGGDKTWLAPQSYWSVFHGAKGWPPEPALDGEPQKAEVLSGGKLRLTTPLSATGIRVIRTMYFDDNGEFVSEQTARKESGAPIKAGIWSITQAVPGQAVFAAVDPKTQFKGGFYRFGSNEKINGELVRPNLVKVVPQPESGGSKAGFETKIAALAAISDGVAWVQKAPRPDGDYPDGTGFPTEYYLSGNPNYYQELEILAPLRVFHKGSSWTHTVRWSLHDLPSNDVNSPAVVDVMEKLLTE